MTQLKDYDNPSPIQIINGLVTTERSGLGKWGPQSQLGLFSYCCELKERLDKTFLPKISTAAKYIMAEIGCYAGESTLMFSSMFNTIIAVDPWINGYDNDDLASRIKPMETVKSSFYKRKEFMQADVIVHEETSEMAASIIAPNSVHFVYIDSIHKLGPCRDTITTWLPKIKSSCYIGGHDFCGYWGEVVDAVLETVGVPDFVAKDGSWLKRIKSY